MERRHRDAKWSTGDVTRHPRLMELAGIDTARERMMGLVWYGHPQAIPVQTRRPLTDVLRELP
ncbi:MAG: hypothetical protein U0872_12850 [Planctomycetaceae bacterium]